MQDICIVRGCCAEAYHHVKTSVKPEVLYPGCRTHLYDIYVFVGRKYGGVVAVKSITKVVKGTLHRVVRSRA